MSDIREMKLLIVDDHPVLREGLTLILKQLSNNTEVIQAASVAEAMAIIDHTNDIDVLIIDLVMPDFDGFEAISCFGSRRPELPIVVLSSSEDTSDVRKALKLGALGYIPKSASPHVLLTALRLVLEGEIYVPSLVLMRPEEPAAPHRGSGGGILTERQIEVLELLSKGHPNKTIAASLDLSEKTVKTHVTAIFKALNVVNRTQAATVGREIGLIR